MIPSSSNITPPEKIAYLTALLRPAMPLLSGFPKSGILFIAFSIVLAIVLFIVNRGYHNLKNKQKIRHLINEIHKKN